MSDTVISESFAFSRRMEEVREVLETLRDKCVPDISICPVENKNGLDDAIDEIEGAMDCLRNFSNHVDDIHRVLKYFIEDLDVAVKNNPS